MDLWESYKSAVFLCHQSLGAQINFAIISAGNPQGRLLAAPRNRSLDYQFESLLRRNHLPCRRVIGASPDLSFQEPSWAVVCDKTQGIDLATRLSQNAMYWVQAGELYLVPALMAEQEVHLGDYLSRQIVLQDL